jgi:hypothetical protein
MDFAANRAAPHQLAGTDLAHRCRGLKRVSAFRANRSQLEDSHFAAIAHRMKERAGLNVDLAAYSEFRASGGVRSSHVLESRVGGLVDGRRRRNG